MSSCIINPSVGGGLKKSTCVCVCVCTLVEQISYTTRFGATVNQRMERSCYDIPNLYGDF